MDYYDMAATVRSQDDIAREHARNGEDEIETMPLLAVACVGLGVFLLWLVCS